MRVRFRAAGPSVTTIAVLAIAICSAPATAIFSVDAGLAAHDPARRPRAVSQRADDAARARQRVVDRTQLLADVATLASPRFEGRATGTSGNALAREWLLKRFQAAGLSPSGADGFVQPFTVQSRDLRAAAPGGRPFRTVLNGANVVGRVAGTEPGAEVIVITAHYDHLGVRSGVVYPGADDNASGTAVLLAAARHFVSTPPRHTMIFAALDGEEIGMRGARALASSALLPRGRIAINVNLDMVGRSAANEIYAAGTYHSPWLRPLLIAVQERAAVTLKFGHDRPQAGSNRQEDWTRSSDHVAFHEMGITFVYFGVEDHPDYHRPTDTADRIDGRFLGDVADMIVDALQTFDAGMR